MSAKKRWIIIVIVVVVLGGALLWLIGGVTQNKEDDENLNYYLDLVQKDRDLQTLVDQSLRVKGLLLDTSGTEIDQVYTIKDIEIIETISKPVLREYGLAIGKALGPYSEIRESELVLMLETLENQDPETQSELTAALKMHENAASNLLAIPVPKDAQVAHLRLTNSIKNMAESLEKMTKVLEDPEAALKESERYIQKFALFLRAVEGVNIYFTNQGMTFGDDETINIYDSLGIISES